MSQGGASQWRGRGGGSRGRGTWRGKWSGRGQWKGKNSGAGTSNQPGVKPKKPQQIPEVVTPFAGWKLYFPEEGYADNSPIVIRVKHFMGYLQNRKQSYNSADIKTKGFFLVDYKDLSSEQLSQSSDEDLVAEIRNSPEIVTCCLGLAMHQLITNELEGETNVLPQDPNEALTQTQLETQASTYSKRNISLLRKIYCRIVNFEPVTGLKHLKANYYGKFASVKGTVVRVSNIKPQCTRMTFECGSCGTLQSIPLPDGKYVLPTKCPAAECRARTFHPKRSHYLTETIDWQTIRVQEIMSDDQRESGRIPRTVDCELTNDLVDSCVPGDLITVSGVVKVMGADDGHSKQTKDKCMFLLYIHANSVTNAKGNKKGADKTTGGVGVEFTMKELCAIEEIHNEPNLFRLIIGSVCPSIYGHEMVKAGLVLGLFGSSQKYVNDKNRIPVRGDPHVLVVGDPGLGKSQMLQAAANVAPRSVYVCANTSSTSGLTVTLSRESGSGDYALEAGALVLADQGCCCIDEFDKMGNQHQALLEAMEQQSISIAKAGIVCSLPARTSIIAAANPVGGHYNKAKTVSENLKMGDALLSRFDLVFILLDKPDEELDSMLSEHVMALHRGSSRSVESTPLRTPQTQEELEAKQRYEAEKPLSERLKVPRGEAFDPIPPVLVRKYIAYARKYVHAKITPEAAKVLQQFYLELRKRHQTKDCTPITTRQLESLIRLTEARARIELREESTEQDARDVVEIMKYSMVDTYLDEFGMLDFQRSQHGSGMSNRSQAKKFIALLEKMSSQTCNSIYTIQEMRQIANQANIHIMDFDNFVFSLNNQGYLIKKGPRVYQLQTTGF